MAFGCENMIDSHVRKQLQYIQFLSKRMLQGGFIGEQRTRKKGYGIEFEQLADYQYGDDVRFIDWKSSARANKMLVKEYTDDRNKTIMLVIDGTQSMVFGTQAQQKLDVVRHIAGALALAAVQQKHPVGMILVADALECYIPPKSFLSHAYVIINKLFSYKPRQAPACLRYGLDEIMRRQKHDSLVCILSDFVDDSFEQSLRVASKKHDIIALRCLDSFERFMNYEGYFLAQDLETGQELTVNGTINEFYREWLQKQTMMFKRYRVDCVDIVPQEDYGALVAHALNKRLYAKGR